MSTPVLKAALGPRGSGAPAAASIHAVLVDPESAEFSEVFFRLDRGTPAFAWSPGLPHPPSAQSRVRVLATVTEDSGAVSTPPPAVFAVGAEWRLERRQPRTVWALGGGLRWSELERVEVLVGAAGADGRPESPTRLELVDGAEPQWATTWLDDADELARELIYRFTDGAELRRGPAPMAATVFEVPAPPPSARITLRLDAELARALGVKAVEATFTDIDGGVLRKTWGPDQFDSDWTLRVPTPAGGTARRAAGQVRYRVSFGEGPEYLSPEGPVTGPGTLTFDFFGAVRFTAEPEAFTQVQSFTPTLTEPVEITGETGGADHPSVTVRIPGDAAGAPLPGAEPHVRWCVRWDLGHANATVTRGSGPRQRVELEAPLGVKTFTFLPVWADGDVELRRLRLTYRSLEEGPDWRIEGDPQSLDLKPGDGPRSFEFPVRCPTRATVFFNGRAITRRGSLPVPDTTVAGTSIPVGASEPWLSIRVNAELVDWSRYDSVRVKLRRDGEPAAAGTLDFTAEDGPRVWGFFGASAADRRYDLEATYRGPGTSGTFRITGQTSELFTLPASPESA